MTDELKKAIENHKKMWEFIKEQEISEPDITTRYSSKRAYLRIAQDEPRNYCYLCEYAYNEYKRNNAGTMCSYCPCLWGSEPYQNFAYCEPEDAEGVDWIDSPADDIINLPVKPELL